MCVQDIICCECLYIVSNLHVHIRTYVTVHCQTGIKMFLLPHSAFGHTGHRQCNIQWNLALPSEDTHHTEGLHLTAGGVDRGTPQICQLAEHNAVLIWDGTARTAV